MTGRCVATNPAGAKCIREATHSNDGHVFPADLSRYAYHLGKLQQAVEMYLDGQADRDFLARVLAETEAEL